MACQTTPADSTDPLDQELTAHDIAMLSVAAAAAIGAALLFALSF